MKAMAIGNLTAVVVCGLILSACGGGGNDSVSSANGDTSASSGGTSTSGSNNSDGGTQPGSGSSGGTSPVPASYVVTTAAGTIDSNGLGVWGYADGPAAAATFSGPQSVAVGSGGQVYIVDDVINLNRSTYPSLSTPIRMLSANGMVSTVAGGDAPLGVGPYAQQCYRPVDGSCAKATFAAPQGIAVDAAGNIYVADFGDLIFMPSILGTIMGYAPSGGTAIRKITDPGSASCTVSTLVAATGACGADSYINFDGPGGLTLDAVGNLYVTQAAAIRKVTPAGVVTTIAGNDNGVTGNTDGPAASATFNGLSGIALDNQGNLYVADSGNHAIRKITPDGMVSTWAGSGALGYTNFSSIGYATINGLTIDTDGNLYLADSYNNAVRRITPDGQVTTLASGCPTGRTLFGNSGTLQPSIRWDAMPTDQACFNGPTGVAVDASGAIYVADTYNFAIRKIAPAQ